MIIGLDGIRCTGRWIDVHNSEWNGMEWTGMGLLDVDGRWKMEDGRWQMEATNECGWQILKEMGR
jgi:hypothetical protein